MSKVITIALLEKYVYFTVSKEIEQMIDEIKHEATKFDGYKCTNIRDLNNGLLEAEVCFYDSQHAKEFKHFLKVYANK